MKILIVDDSKLLRTKISNLISNLGHEVVAQAKDAQEGIVKYKEFWPDIILSDYEMPDINGIEMAREIYKINKNAIIILITSMVDKKITLEALKSGIRTVLTKPITLEQLREELAKYE